jgi:hypothetical protein
MLEQGFALAKSKRSAHDRYEYGLKNSPRVMQQAAVARQQLEA